MQVDCKFHGCPPFKVPNDGYLTILSWEREMNKEILTIFFLHW